MSWQTAPSVMNTFLWRCIVKEQRDGELGYWIGYASIWDQKEHVHWRWVSAQNELITDSNLTRSIETIQWFSMGYWIARKDEQGLAIADLRFGETTMASSDLEGIDQPWIFNWQLTEDGGVLPSGSQLPTEL